MKTYAALIRVSEVRTLGAHGPELCADWINRGLDEEVSPLDDVSHIHSVTLNPVSDDVVGCTVKYETQRWTKVPRPKRVSPKAFASLLSTPESHP